MNKLDHFQIYNLENPVDVTQAGVLVGLTGLFDDEVEQVAKLGIMIRFADRVSKNGEALADPLAHFTIYTLPWKTDPRVIRQVTIKNQFITGEQELEIHEVVALWAPAQKQLGPGRKKPWSLKTQLDHYKVYEAHNGQPGVHDKIDLKDQFDSRQNVRVYYPVAFAVPVAKKYKEQGVILNDDVFLTIYAIDTSKDLSVVINTLDQFWPRYDLRLGVSRLLAVPTKMVSWKEA
jgi:hypothetical protein